jgi:putative endonuclease
MPSKAKGPAHISLGKIGEDVAVRYLLKRGFSIIERNFRKKYGEIDIVAKAPDKTLVFVEVKTMATGLDLTPEDQYSASKRQKTERICRAFANGNPKLVNENRGWRMDLIAIQIPREVSGESKLTMIEKSCEIKYYENV